MRSRDPGTSAPASSVAGLVEDLGPCLAGDESAGEVGEGLAGPTQPKLVRAFRNGAPTRSVRCRVMPMEDEHGDAAGSERSAEAVNEITRPIVDEQRTGLPAGVADLAGDEPEKYFQRLIAQLEAEADQIRAPRRQGPAHER
jgi:hypothetical protein